jgi:tripartite-type tricarboxylate transporter receptor subunit TctC
MGCASTAVGQTYPTRPIRIVVPQSAGGSTDLVARPLAQLLSGALGQNVIVENRPGAGSTLGTDVVAKSSPDGYTVLAVAASFAISPSLYRQLPYDPVGDFAPVTQVSAFPNIMVVPRSLPVTSIAELIAYARARPGQLNYASSGVGTGTHLSMELFKTLAGLDIVHVPYKGGAPAVNALLAGQVQVNLATISTALPYVKSGELRALAVTTAKRWPAVPDLPTLAEGGLPDYEYSSWVGLLAPAKTPPAVVQRLWTETAKAARAPEMKRILAHEGAEPVGNSPAEFATIIQREIVTWKKVVEKAGIKAD